MITEYDPDIRWACHTIQLTFMQWNYSTQMEVEVKGNVIGAELFEGAVRYCFDELYDKAKDYTAIILKRPAEDGKGGEDELEVSLEDEDDLMPLCVGVCILKHEAEDRNALWRNK